MLAGIGAALGAIPSAAAQSSGFDLQPYRPSPASDPHFVTASARAPGHLKVSGKLINHFAYKPLLQRTDRSTGQVTEIVSRQYNLYADATLALDDRWLVRLDVPLSAWQDGEGPLAPDAPSFGDVLLGGRGVVLETGVFDLGFDVDLFLPSGSPDDFTGDPTVRAGARAVGSGRLSLFVYSANLGFLYRDSVRTEAFETGPSFTFAAAAGVLLLDDSLQVGTELSGHAAVGGDRSAFTEATTPVFGLLGAKYRWTDFVFGLGVGPGLSRAAGSSPRAVLSLGYVPRAKEAAVDTGAPDASGARNASPPRTQPPPEPAGTAAEPPPTSPTVPAAPPVDAPTANEPATPPTEQPAPEATAPPAGEPPAPPSDEAMTEAQRTELAREQFLRGVTAYDAGRYEEARQAFESAYRTRPHPTILRNLAQSELMGGRRERACEHFRQWKREIESPKPEDVDQVNESMINACR